MDNKINFMGDLIFGDQPVIYGFGLNSIWSNRAYNGIFDGVYRFLQEGEYNIANFEAVIKKDDNPKKTVSDWSMCCEENVCEALKKNKINIVSVANNHTMDYGRSWFDYTVKALQDHNISVIGLKEKPYIKLISSQKKIAVIACSYLKINSKEEIGYLYNPSLQEWRELVDECADCDEKIVYVHWGSEFIVQPTEKQYNIAKEILSSGVDMIIGHHSHILQSKETIDGKKVIFSLGNFVSDYWQKRLRRTEIVSYLGNGQLKKIDVMINNEGAPEAIRDKSEDVLFDVPVKSYSVTISRLRMRIEYFIKILFNFYRIKEKRAFIKWLWKRVKYVLLFSWREVRDPEIVYEYYEN